MVAGAAEHRSAPSGRTGRSAALLLKSRSWLLRNQPTADSDPEASVREATAGAQGEGELESPEQENQGCGHSWESQTCPVVGQDRVPEPGPQRGAIGSQGSARARAAGPRAQCRAHGRAGVCRPVTAAQCTCSPHVRRAAAWREAVMVLEAGSSARCTPLSQSVLCGPCRLSRTRGREARAAPWHTWAGRCGPAPELVLPHADRFRQVLSSHVLSRVGCFRWPVQRGLGFRFPEVVSLLPPCAWGRLVRSSPSGRAGGSRPTSLCGGQCPARPPAGEPPAHRPVPSRRPARSWLLLTKLRSR